MSAGSPRRYRAREPIFHAGDRGGFVVLITAGRAKVTVPSPTGAEAVLSIRGPGDLLGDLAALDDDAVRTATVVAIDAVVCRVVRAQDFRNIVATHPGIALELVRMVGARLRSADRRLVDAGTYDAGRRLARLLADMADAGGTEPGGALVVGAGLSQDDLAGLVGASRESVARALGDLRARGLVSTSRRQVVVLDLPGLRSYGD